MGFCLDTLTLQGLGLLQGVGDSALDNTLRLGGLVDSHAEMWLWLSLVLLIAEILTVGFFAAAMALAALVTSLGAVLGLGPYGQLALFSLFAIGSMIWIRPVFVRWLSPRTEQTNTDALVGRSATVTEQVPAGGTGRVRLTNEEWRATADEKIDEGTAVKVLAVEGNTLTVTRA